MDLSELDVVYPVRPGGNNEELRYSLRSLDKNFPHRNVWLLGMAPHWVQNLSLLSYRQTSGKYQNVQTMMRTICQQDEVSDPFILFNDDFYILQPHETLPTYHRGTADEFLTERRVVKGSLSRYDIGQRTTKEVLEKYGYSPEEILCYELHLPMVVYKDAWVEAYKAILPYYSNPARYRVQMRTMYGNWAQLGGQKLPPEWAVGRQGDVKIYDPTETFPEDIPYLSGTDTLFNSARSPLRKLLRARFPKSSSYEGKKPYGRTTHNRQPSGNRPWRIVHL